MKPSFLKSVLAVLLATIIFNNISAQSVASASANDRPANIYDDCNMRDQEKDFFLNALLSKVHTKTVREFTRRFGHVKNVKWFKSDNGTMAYFSRDGITTKSAYDRWGKWLYDLNNFPEALLSRDIRSLVKSVYYDFDITLVDEIISAHQRAHIVHLKDDKGWRNVQVCEGEMKEIELLSDPGLD